MNDCAGCNLIETNPVTLIDGTIVCLSCEAWRHECEARHILKTPGLERRRAMLGQIEAKRGAEAAKALRVTMTKIYQRR